MGGSRIKSLVIAALALINIFFLTVIVIDTVADARNERQTIENVCVVLRSGGIEINPDDVRADSSLRAMRTARGDAAEEAIARAILGKTEMTVQGVIHIYENLEKGIAEFYSGGDFEINVSAGEIRALNGAVRTVQRLLRDMKLETSEITQSGDEGSETVVAVSSYKKSSIINCTIEFVFAGEYLETVKGRYVTDIELIEDGARISHVGTALLGFLAAVRNEEREDVVCTYISGVETGFQHHVVGSFGEGVITPVWLITTDMGRYIIVDATGEILPLINQPRVYQAS